MKTIPLTQGREAIVDDVDYEWLSQWKWCFLEQERGMGYAVRNGVRGTRPRMIRMHRLVLGIMDKPDAIADHINQNGLDNRRSNLRITDKQGNSQNMKKASTPKSSAYKGVHWCNTRGVWIARIVVEGGTKTIGHYGSEQDAALAYNKAADAYFGEFACLN